MRSRHLLALLWLAQPPLAGADTIVPKLDQGGRPGEVARMVYEKAVKQFDDADADRDGKLTREEVARVSPFKAEAFEQFDVDHDGFLTWEEFVGHDRWKKN